MDQTQLIVSFQFLSQIADIHFKHIALTAKVITPHTIKNNFTCQNLFGVTKKKLEQLILFCRQ